MKIPLANMSEKENDTEKCTWFTTMTEMEPLFEKKFEVGISEVLWKRRQLYYFAISEILLSVASAEEKKWLYFFAIMISTNLQFEDFTKHMKIVLASHTCKWWHEMGYREIIFEQEAEKSSEVE